MSKSEEEIQIFKTFCEVAGAAKFEDFKKRDPLDFISNDGSLGIELVSYHRDAKRGDARGSPLRVSEARLQRLVGDAKACYEKRYKDRADVYFFPQLGPSRTTSVLSTEAGDVVPGDVVPEVCFG